MSAPRRSFSQMFLTPVGPQNFHLRAQRDYARGDTLIFFGDTGHRSRDRALADEALKLFIGAQAQHLFPSTGSIPFPAITSAWQTAGYAEASAAALAMA